MNSGSSLGVLALASIDSATSKVLASNWRLVTWTLSESCGWVCSIRLCGARGFSKLRSLMYWPCMISGALGACWGAAPCGPRFCGGGGALVMALLSLLRGGRYHAGLHCTSRGQARQAAICKAHPPNKRIAGTFCTLRQGIMDRSSLRPPAVGSHGLFQGKRPRRLASHGWRQVCPGGRSRPSAPCRS